jgi:hypothetical protein
MKSRKWAPFKISVLVLILVAIPFIGGCMQLGKKQPKTPLEISNITIEPIDSTTVRISWNTNKETLGGVYLVEQDKETLVQESPQQRSKSHSVTIGGLPPGPDYVFEIGAEFYGADGFTEEYSHKRVTFRMP